jgi:hypothetical protein
MTKIFLLAHGEQTRMEALLTHPKQFLDINGTPLIVRTIRQIQAIVSDWQEAVQIVVVAPDTDEWRRVILPTGAQLYTQPHAGLVQLDIIRNLRQHFGAVQTVFLQGDTIFSDIALRGLLTDTSVFSFVVRGGTNMHTGVGRHELYGWSVYERGYFTLDGLLANPKVTPYFELRLFWDLLYQLQEKPEKVGAGAHWASTHILGSEDYTDDVDYPDDIAAAELIADTIYRRAQIARWRTACGL